VCIRDHRYTPRFALKTYQGLAGAAAKILFVRDIIFCLARSRSAERNSANQLSLALLGRVDGVAETCATKLRDIMPCILPTTVHPTSAE